MDRGGISELLKSKDLLLELVKREIKAKYKQSVLGYAWVLLVPLINLVVLSVVFSYFIKIPTGGIPYPIFLFTALVPWIFTANAISSATKSLLSNKTLITKIYLPRVVFPLSAIFAKFVDLLLYALILIGFMLVMGIDIQITMLYIPIIFTTHMMLISGISFILSATNVYYRDVENLLEVAIAAWMYLTPVIYPPELVPERFRQIFNLNPMTPIINSYRNVVLHGVAPPWESFGFATLVSLILLVFGYLYFKSRSKNFADVV